MKRFVILLLALVPVIAGCENENPIDLSYQVRKTAWSSLQKNEQATVTIKWQDAKVEEGKYKDKSVYAVFFNTKDDALLGPIVVYVEKKSLKVLGYGLRY